MAKTNQELDLTSDTFHLGIPNHLIKQYPIIKMAVTALTYILRATTCNKISCLILLQSKIINTVF